jgi:LPXTG-motif cell wall-anchored protein
VHKIGPGEALPQVEAVVVDPGGKVVVLGMLSPAQVETLERALGAQIARTGSNTSNLVLVGLVVLVVGSALAAFAARARRTG